VIRLSVIRLSTIRLLVIRLQLDNNRGSKAREAERNRSSSSCRPYTSSRVRVED